MRKTFKSVCVPGLELNISPSYQGIALTVTMDGELYESQGVTLSAGDAASFMLAIAEAAGVSPRGGSVGAIEHGTADHLSYILRGLQNYQEAKERDTAEAKDRAKLEAEALGLFKASGAYGSDRILLKFSDLDDHIQKAWLNVARKAREMGAEK